MKLTRLIVPFCIIVALASCKRDDGDVAPPDPPRLLSEVAVEDEAKIQEYLKTHYYNYDEFQNPPENFDYKIRLMEIPGDDTTGIIPLIDSVQTQIIKLSSANLGIDTEESNIEHTLYYLSARPGVGENPTVVDSVFVKYEGTLLDGTVFDSKLNAPVWFDLQGTLSQSNPGNITGFKIGLPKFKSGGETIINDDGTYEVKDFDTGLLVLPSALAYYNGFTVGPAYSPIIFTIQLLAVNTADHDRDGIPTIDEVQVDEQGLVTLTDTDGDGIPDYLDADS